MVEIATDARFTNLKISPEYKDFFYVDGIPLLSNTNEEFFLNLVLHNGRYYIGNADTYKNFGNIQNRFTSVFNKSRIAKMNRSIPFQQQQQLLRGDVIEPYGTISAADALTILQLSVESKDMSFIAGREVLAFVYSDDNNLPSVWNGSDKPTLNDALVTLYYSVQKEGYENPIVYNPPVAETPTLSPTPTVSETLSVAPTPTVTTSPVGGAYETQLGNGWLIRAFEGHLEEAHLDFVRNSEVVASIFPNIGETLYSINDFSFNSEKLLSANEWSVIYPDVNSSSGLSEGDTQLKFIYKGYIQTLVIPYLGNDNGINTIENTIIDVGQLWAIKGHDSSLEFYYRNSINEQYYPQIIIGSSNYNLNTYIETAEKFPLKFSFI
jgi:hypothetical protein